MHDDAMGRGPSVAAAASPESARPRVPISSSYWVALDGLRGAAVIAVILYHFHVLGTRGGWIGVDVFFVLSGFVVTNNLIRNRERGVGYKQFMARRAARLYPALVVVVAAMLAWNAIKGNGLRRSTLGAAWTSLCQAYNLLVVPLHLDGGSFAPLWSLGVEWQFYLIAPLIVAVLARYQRRRAALIAMSLAALVIVSRPVTQMLGVSAFYQYTAPWFRLDGLLLGVAGSFVYRNLLPRECTWLARLAVPCAVLLGVLVGVAPGWFVWQGPSLSFVIPVASIASFVLVLGFGARVAPKWLESLLSMRWLVFIGERAYSLYLWNYFIGQVVSRDMDSMGGARILGERVALTFAAALASYHFVERPAREHLNRWMDNRTARRRVRDDVSLPARSGLG